MRKFIAIAVLFVALPVWSAPGLYHNRGNAFEVTVGGGYSSLGYRVNNITDDLSSTTVGTYGLQAHFGYNWFFSEYAGLAVGVDMQHYGQKTTLNGTIRWDGVTDTDGELYEHMLDMKNWSEQQDYWTVEIPVSVVLSLPIRNRVYVTLQAGGKYGIPLSQTYAAKGTLTHSGYYQPWNLTLTDKPNHGFYTEEHFHPKGTLQKKNYWTVFAKAGVAIPLGEQLDLLVQAYFNYALTNISDKGQNESIGFRNDRPGQEQTHYFMTDYIDLSNTDVITDAFKPWSAGLEIGIRYTIAPKKVHYPCQCMENYYVY